LTGWDSLKVPQQNWAAQPGAAVVSTSVRFPGLERSERLEAECKPSQSQRWSGSPFPEPCTARRLWHLDSREGCPSTSLLPDVPWVFHYPI